MTATPDGAVTGATGHRARFSSPALVLSGVILGIYALYTWAWFSWARFPVPARVLAGVIAAVITALYASVVVRGVVDLIELPRAARENMGLGVTATGVFWLWFGVLFPLPIYAGSVLAVRRQTVPIRLLALLTGLGVVAVVQLEVSYLVSRLAFFA